LAVAAGRLFGQPPKLRLGLDQKKGASTVIRAVNVTKRYGKKILANNNVCLETQPGEIAILLGPNGAGKSTLIKCVCGLLRFEGTIEIGGLKHNSLEAKRIISYVPEFPALYPTLTVDEHLEFIARAYKLHNWQDRASDLLEEFEMIENRSKLGKELSKGMQQKVSICCALSTNPKVLILDEPLVGLDPHGIRELKNMISKLKADGATLLISTHMIESVEENWDVTFIMSKGAINSELRRSEENPQKLEDLYFAVTEGRDPGK
jgi:ABC-type multidrug transport system ATPase subunit